MVWSGMEWCGVVRRGEEKHGVVRTGEEWREVLIKELRGVLMSAKSVED